MADAQLEVLFKVLTDHVGADQAKQVIADLKKQTAGAGDEAKNLTKHSREMREVFHKLNEIVPGLGMAMKAAFNPQMIGMIGTMVALTAVLKLIQAVKQADEESKKAAEDNAAAAAKGYGDVLASIRSVRAEILQSDRDSAAWAANLGKVMDPITKNLDALLEKMKLMDEALRALDKSAGRGERVPIEKAELTATAAALKALSTSQVSAESKYEAAYGAQRGVEMKGGVADYAAQIKDREEKAADADRKAKAAMDEADKIAAEARKAGVAPEDVRKYREAKATADAEINVRDRNRGIIVTLRKAQEEYNAALDDAKRKTGEARAEVETLNKSFETLQQKVQSLQRGLDVKGAAGAAAQQPEFGTLTAGASALVRLQQHGGRVAELASADQSALLALDNYLKSHGVLSFGMLKLIQQHAGDLEWQAKEIQRIDNYARSTRKMVHSTTVQ